MPLSTPKMPPSGHRCQPGTSSPSSARSIASFDFPPSTLHPSHSSDHCHSHSSRSRSAPHHPLAMVTNRAFALDVSQPGAAAMALDQDWHALGDAISTLGGHLAESMSLDASLSLGGFLRWLAVIAAIYLLVLDKTNWRTNLLTALLVPYLALQLPEPFFGYLRGGIGAWIAFIAVVIRLFFAQKFPDLIHGDLELPVAFILLIVTAPHLIVHTRGYWVADVVSLLIGAYLLFEHTSHEGGFRRAFGETHGAVHTIGILLLFVAPAYSFIKNVT